MPICKKPTKCILETLYILKSSSNYPMFFYVQKNYPMFSHVQNNFGGKSFFAKASYQFFKGTTLFLPVEPNLLLICFRN